MRRMMMLAAPLILALVPAPAAAMTAAQADCPYKAVGADLAYELIGVLLADNKDTARLQDLTSQIDDASENCAESLGIPKASREDYSTFGRSRVAFFGITRRMAERGMPIDAINEIMDFGPGRTNPSREDIGRAGYDKLVAGLQKKGVDLDKFQVADWKLLGAYLGTAGRMYQLMESIK